MPGIPWRRKVGSCGDRAVKILSLNPYIPHPLNSGGNLRSHHIVAALVDDHEVTFASQWGCGEQVDDWEFASRFAEEPVLVPCASPSGANSSGARLRRGAPQPWFGLPESVARRDFDSFWDALGNLPLDSYDAIQVRTFHLIPYALAIRAAYPRVRLVLDLDDVPSVFSERTRRDAKMGWISRWRWQSYLDYCRIRMYENRFLEEFDAVWVCSELDRARVARWISPEKVVCIPNGVDVAAYASLAPAADSQKLLFIAYFAHDPNEAGAEWFHNGVLPEIRKQVPGVELWLVGREASPRLLDLDSPERGVHVTGQVPQVEPYLAAAAVSIVPLRVGTGTRLKILEAMAAGLPVVSTTIGAEGIEVLDGENIVLADTTAAMATACIWLLKDPQRRERLGEAGRRLVREKYDWGIIHRRIRECYDRMPCDRRSLCKGNQKAIG